MSFGSNSLKENLSKPKGGTQKKFGPGNHTCKINSIHISEVVWKGVPKMFLHLNMETKPVGDGFEGFLLDKDNPKGGRHKGQINSVKTSGFGYDDNRKDKDGKTISKEDSVVMFLDSLCHEACKSTWVKDAIVNGTYKTFADFIAGFNKDNPVADVFLHYCLGGTQDTNDDGYPVYFLNLPKYEKGYRLYGNDEHESNVLPYNKSEHLYVKSEPTPVAQFKPEEDSEEEEAPAMSLAQDEEIDFSVEEDQEVPFDMDEDAEEDFGVED